VVKASAARYQTTEIGLPLFYATPSVAAAYDASDPPAYAGGVYGEVYETFA
jgi:hypothetical protein